MTQQRPKDSVLATIAGLGVVSGAAWVSALPLPVLVKVVIVGGLAVLMERALRDRIRNDRRRAYRNAARTGEDSSGSGS
jgi:Ni/Fe-hydrogenase subunit HybB-like protein